MKHFRDVVPLRDLPRLALVLAVAGCASTAPPTLASGGTSTVVNSDWGRGATIEGDNLSVAPSMLDAPVEQTWVALLQALTTTGVPVNVVSQATWTAGTQPTRIKGRIAGQPLSTFLACGGTAGVAEVADAHAVTMGILATLRPVEGRTQLQIQVTGSAKDPFTSVPARHCVSRGKLEAQIAAAVRQHLNPSPANVS